MSRWRTARGLPAWEGLPVQGLREGCTDGRDYLCLGSHVWAELAQGNPRSGETGIPEVVVMVGTKSFCPQVAESQTRAGSGLI